MPLRRRRPAPARHAAPTPAAQLPAPTLMSEARLLGEVLALAHQEGLLAYHCPDSRRSTGAGFPDLVIAGPGGVILRELKAEYGVTNAPQEMWAHWLDGPADYGVWRPRDLNSGKIQRILESLAMNSSAREDPE